MERHVDVVCDALEHAENLAHNVRVVSNAHHDVQITLALNELIIDRILKLLNVNRRRLGRQAVDPWHASSRGFGSSAV